MAAITVGKIKDRIVQVVRVADTVGFSSERGWVMICTDWEQAERRKTQFRWVPASTRFEWIRTFTFTEEQYED
jgi:hypothetical protein